MAVEYQQERRAVGRRRGRGLGADRARRAAAILDDDGGLQLGLQQRLNPPCDLVGRSAGRERHDEADGIGRPALSMAGACPEQPDASDQNGRQSME